MPRTSNVAAGFIIMSIVPCATSTPCHMDFPPGAWQPRIAREAALAGSPNVSVPLVGSGFNRTLNIDGFCNDILMSSESFACEEKTSIPNGEWSAKVAHTKTAPTGSFLRFNGVNCPLAGISMRRLPVGAQFEAEIRFEFEFCKAAAGFPASPVASAAVTMGLRKDSGTPSNVVPWMKEVCKVQTTTPGVATVVVKTSTELVNVGNGTCKAAGGEGKAVAGMNTAAACKGECSFKINEAKATGATDGGCSGFAFNAKAAAGKQCLIYTGDITALDKEDADWACLKMELKAQKYAKTTEAPPAIEALPELTQNLHLREVFAGAPASMSGAKLQQIQPATGDDFCFPAAWWFNIEDINGVPASLPVNEASWADLMASLPAPKETKETVRSTMFIDRVLVRTCQPKGMPKLKGKESGTAVGWGRECVMPKVETVCDSKQIVNAVVTGILTPILGWLLVRCIFNALPPRVRQVQNYDFSDDQGDFPRCAVSGIILMCIAAIFCCALVSAGSSAAVSYSFGAAGCLHGVREMVVVGCAAGVPSCLAMIVGLLYLYHSGSKHASDKQAGGGAAASGAWQPPKGHKLMLLEVPEGAGPMSGTPINPDIMQTGNSAMASYANQGYPSSIVVDQTSAMLSSYQSQSPGGM